MSKVIPIVTNEVEHNFRELAKMAKNGKITYAMMLLQMDDGQYVEWKPFYCGEKSGDYQHLLNEIGHYYVITQSVFEEIVESVQDESTD